MPELHQLTPALTSLQDRGFKVALVTDGRMSGASGTVPAAIHLTPEADAGGPLARVRNGDVIRLDAHTGTLELLGCRRALARNARPPGSRTIHASARVANSSPISAAWSATPKAARCAASRSDTDPEEGYPCVTYCSERR